MPTPKRIVYLFGAGATQAEIAYRGLPSNLLMHDLKTGAPGIASGILGRLGGKATPFVADRIDIEKLISLLSSSGIGRLADLAETMRGAYYEEIRDRLAETTVIDTPTLAMALFEMHADPVFQRTTEVMTGIVTTNHDGLLQVASQRILSGINIGIPFVSGGFTQITSDQIPLVLQLHGSFTWKRESGMRVEQLSLESVYSGDTAWIPPAVLKESRSYPFNKLIGHAHEVLAQQCDVLRVVGASLSQNDWNVLSLMFNAQQQCDSGVGPFRIELIMPHKHADRVVDECSYLRRMMPIGDLTEGDFGVFKEVDDPPPDSDLHNPFLYWLKEKATYHRNNGDLGAGKLPASLAEVLGE